MKKTLTVLLVIISVSLFSNIAYAKDTVPAFTTVPLDGKFTLCLQSNSLVFKGEPKDKGFDSVTINLTDPIRPGKAIESTHIAHTVTRDKGKVDGATINLSDVPDGTYNYLIVYTGQNYATSYDFTDALNIVIKGGKASLQSTGNYAENLKVLGNERTDVYALDFYRNKTILTDPYYAGVVKQAKSIVAGITATYAQAKAIHDWVACNISYEDGCDVNSAPEVLLNMKAVCDGYANLSVALLQAAGLPAKKIVGNASLADHAWTEVYADNRWFFFDCTWDTPLTANGSAKENYFDETLLEDSGSRFIYEATVDGTNGDEAIWDGTLTFVKVGPNGAIQDKPLKEIKNYPLNSLVTSTYGYNAKDMYSDPNSIKHWNFSTAKIDSYNHTIFVKIPYYTISFDTQGGKAVKSVDVKPSADGFCKVPKPVDPKRSGYTFKGWVEGDSQNITIWDFKRNVVSYDTTLYAKWTKNKK